MSVLVLEDHQAYGAETRTPAIPSVETVGNSVESIRVAVARLREVVQVREGLVGNPLDQNVTWRDLYDNGVVSLRADGTAVPRTVVPPGSVGPATPSAPNLNEPPRPTGFVVTGGFSNIFLQWDDANAVYSNHAYTEVFRNTVNNFGTARSIARVGAMTWADPVGNNTLYYYWIRHVSRSDVAGAISATAGTVGQTALDPGYMIAVLRDEVLSTLTAANTLLLGDPAKFRNVYVVANRFAIVTDSSSTTGKVPFIVDGGTTYIDIAMIKDATITNAKIGSLAADKITAGTITASIGLTAATITGGSLNIASKFIVTTAGDVTVTTNQFLIRHESNGTLIQPFRVVGANTFIDNAYITNLSATNIGVGQVTGDRLANSTITAAQILNGTITGVLIANGTITASNIAANTITAANIATGAITAAQIANGTVTAAQIQNGTITGVLIQNGTITANKLTVGSLDAISATLGTVTAGVLTASKIVYGSSIVGDIAYPNDTMATNTVQGFSGTFNAIGTGVQTGSPAVVFYMPNTGGGSYANRARGGNDIPFLITCSAVVDHFLSVWVRYNGGAWNFLCQTVEPQSGYGSATIAFATKLNIGFGNYAEFGVAVTNSSGVVQNPGATDLKDCYFSVVSFNF